MTLDHFTIFGLQLGFTWVSFYLMVKYYLWPRLTRMPVEAALQALVATNTFRHLGLAFIVVPTLVAESVPRSWTEPLAYGDLIAVTLAIVAFLGLAQRKSWGKAATWVFNIIGCADLLMAFATGVPAHAWDFQLGTTWYITTFLAPVFLTIHAMIFLLLTRSRPR